MADMPQRAAADYASRLKKIAEQLPEDRQSLAPQLIAMAGAFERAINNTNNAAAGVIGLVELQLTERIDKIDQHVAELRGLFEQHDVAETHERQELASQIGELQQAVNQILGLLRDEAEASGGDG